MHPPFSMIRHLHKFFYDSSVRVNQFNDSGDASGRSGRNIPERPSNERRVIFSQVSGPLVSVDLSAENRSQDIKSHRGDSINKTSIRVTHAV
jgi:hypothetical protein